MEWIKNNPSLFFTICVGVVLMSIYDMTLGKKFMKRNFEKQADKNKASLCARCSNKYNKNYYIVRRLNYCSPCFERMFYDIKLGGGFLGLITICSIIIMIVVYLPEAMKGSATSENLWRLFVFLLLGGEMLWWLSRSYLELKKAKIEHKAARHYYQAGQAYLVVNRLKK